MDQTLRRKLDHITDVLWAGGVTNPVTYIEQISYLIYLKLLDEEESERELRGRLGAGNGASLFPRQAARFRWSKWRFQGGEGLRNFVRDEVFPYMASLVKDEPHVADYFRDAVLEIVDPNVLKQVIDELDSIDFRKLGPDIKGDIFEYLLTHLGQSALNGQFRTPRQIRAFMVQMVDPDLGDTIQMLTKLTIRNFKRFGEVEIELGSPVVFIGPNNSGKTSAMQALALWDIGLKRWNEKRSGKNTPEKRPGVTVSRRDLVAIPIPDANLLWRDLHVRDVQKVDGKPRTSNIRIDIVVEGMSNDQAWSCGLEFDYANEESFYCRPLRQSDGKTPARMPVPEEAGGVRVAFLPPMSGLAATETRLDAGAVDVRIGEGRTAEVLRNLCFHVHGGQTKHWERLVEQIECLFGTVVEPPRYVAERGEIVMSYRERGTKLDLSSAGRGLQQTLLLLAYMYANPGSVLLLDEPDAHLEILRQRQTYRLLTEVARESGSQIIAASHSEVLLNEAAERDLVVAFVGQQPHRIDDRGSQVLKALREIGFDQYYQAEQAGWVLYLEGSTDLAILHAFAKRLAHEGALEALGRPFVKYVENNASAVRYHYHGLREAVPRLTGVVLFDRLDSEPGDMVPVQCLTWKRREVENYLCTRATLEAYAAASGTEAAAGPLFTKAEGEKRINVMREAISEAEAALEFQDKGSPWGPDIKASDEVLVHVFRAFFEKLGLPNLMAKMNCYELADYVPESEIDPEIREKLDAIVRVAESATPAGEPS